jgi:hypothetical protein
MSKFLTLTALACAAIGFYDLAAFPPGSPANHEAGVLFILAMLLIVISVVTNLATTKICAHCCNRIKKSATKCPHCQTVLA